MRSGAWRGEVWCGVVRAGREDEDDGDWLCAEGKGRR